MKSFCLFLSTYLFLVPSLPAQSWMRQLSHSFDLSAGNMTDTYDQGMALVGTIEDLSGHDEVYVVKMDSASNLVWQFNYHNSEDILGENITQLADSGFLVQGRVNNTDWMLLRLDKDGQMLWSKKVGGSASC